MANTLLEQLSWRYATKKMDPSKAVPQDKVDAIIEAIRMAPTSSGTQPFELIVVKQICYFLRYAIKFESPDHP